MRLLFDLKPLKLYILILCSSQYTIIMEVHATDVYFQLRHQLQHAKDARTAESLELFLLLLVACKSVAINVASNRNFLLGRLLLLDAYPKNWDTLDNHPFY
ncbi:hypothetical protein Leryth_027561 [Lithospermum erythrorhizon]|nr:hypothetical protein Leryth_027561 [Lithospermum erythrorhizon]